MGEALHAVLSFDDAYWAPAIATIRSVAISTKRRGDLQFHLMGWRVTQEHRVELAEAAAAFGAISHFTALEDDRAMVTALERLPRHRAFPPIVYARLYLDRLLPAHVARFVYLDCDVMVRAPIEQLIDIDLGGMAIAAAPEPGRHRLILGDDMRGRRSPFDAADYYFNSGVLVADRPRWREAGLPELLDRLVSRGDLAALYHDQDVLNLAFRGQVMQLSPLWNLTKPSPALRSLDPYIVHYTTGMKPWQLVSVVAFGSTYKHVMTRQLVRRYRRYRLGVWLSRRLRLRPRS